MGERAGRKYQELGRSQAKEFEAFLLSPRRAVKDSVLNRTDHLHTCSESFSAAVWRSKGELQGWEIRFPWPESRIDIMRAQDKCVETSMMASVRSHRIKL